MKQVLVYTQIISPGSSCFPTPSLIFLALFYVIDIMNEGWSGLVLLLVDILKGLIVEIC